jgi:dihydropteroate synthase
MRKIVLADGRRINFEHPRVMGVLNLTPDSFFEGSRLNSVDDSLKAADKMLQEGADFLDIGAYSSRPGATDVSQNEELARLISVVKALVKEFPEAILSVDTFRSGVAAAAVAEGVAIVNDISAGELDSSMIETVAKLKVPYIFMHMKGTPQNMKQLAQYDDVVLDVFKYLNQKVEQIKQAGISSYIVDPGFGFAKTIEHNYQLLNGLDTFTHSGEIVLVGLSRKSMIWKVLGVDASAALNGTVVLNTMALMKGANILRVHDVKPAVEAITLLKKLNSPV